MDDIGKSYEAKLDINSALGNELDADTRCMMETKKCVYSENGKKLDFYSEVRNLVLPLPENKTRQWRICFRRVHFVSSYV